MRRYTGTACVVLTVAALGLGWLVEPVSTRAQQGPPPKATRIATADDLPEVGQCRPTAPQPKCNELLAKYRSAYVALVAETETFHKAMLGAFNGTLWTPAVREKAAALRAKLDSSTAITNLNTLITKLDAKTFADKLKSAQEKHKTFLEKQDIWVADPLKERKALEDARNDYIKSLRDVFQLADTYQAFDQQFTPIMEAISAIKKTADDAHTITKSAELRAYAGELSKLVQASSEALETKYQAAEDALKAARREGLELKPKESQSSGKDIVIVDAVYGDIEVIRKLKDLLKRGADGDGLFESTTESERASICHALAYAKNRCEYVKVKRAFCTKEDGRVFQACDDPPKDIKFNRYETVDYEPKPGPRRICEIPVELNKVCGGAGNPAPTKDRELLVVYKCGPSGEVEFKRARDNTAVFLLCE